MFWLATLLPFVFTPTYLTLASQIAITAIFAVSLDLNRVPVLPVFKWLAAAGKISEHEMLRTFNCGIGMVAVLDRGGAEAASARFAANGETVVRLGEVISADDAPRVVYRGSLDLTR